MPLRSMERRCEMGETYLEKLRKLRGSIQGGSKPISEETAKSLVEAFEKRVEQVRQGDCKGSPEFEEWVKKTFPKSRRYQKK